MRLYPGYLGAGSERAKLEKFIAREVAAAFAHQKRIYEIKAKHYRRASDYKRLMSLHHGRLRWHVSRAVHAANQLTPNTESGGD
ncbi:MAG: hypothetical protein MSG64_16730 [Pyrinomonadaceae bacterium MAG19_C2-C3]|nr:hypothetical protein [Pyrinomonadaceae bacterium MAG19_C2-C3]